MVLSFHIKKLRHGDVKIFASCHGADKQQNWDFDQEVGFQDHTKEPLFPSLLLGSQEGRINSSSLKWR